MRTLFAVISLLLVSQSYASNPACPDLTGHYICKGYFNGREIQPFGKAYSHGTDDVADYIYVKTDDGREIKSYLDGKERPQFDGGLEKATCHNGDTIFLEIKPVAGGFITAVISKTESGFYVKIQMPLQTTEDVGWEECILD